MTDGRKLFDKPVKNDLRTYDNTRKITVGQGDNYTFGYLLDYPCFKEYDKLITIDINKQQKLDADPKAVQQINCIGNLDRDRNTQFFLLLKKWKK